MAFESVQFGDRKPQKLNEGDIRYAIQDYLRTATRAQGIYCSSVREAVAYVVVDSPALMQEALLLEHDLIRHIQDTVDHSITRIVVTQS